MKVLWMLTNKTIHNAKRNNKRVLNKLNTEVHSKDCLPNEFVVFVLYLFFVGSCLL